MLPFDIIPKRAKIVFSTRDLKVRLYEHIKSLYPEKVLDDREVGEILHSIIGAVITPLVDADVPQNAYEQGSLDLLEFYLPSGRDHSDKPYDIYVALESWVIRLILTVLPQLLKEGSFQVIGFSLAEPNTLVLTVTTDVINNRAQTSKGFDMESPEWGLLEPGRF